MRFVRRLGSVLGALAALALAGDALAGEDFRQILRRPVSFLERGRTQYGNAVDALVEAAARGLPIPAASGAFTYRYDQDTGRYERSTETFGPLYMERAATLGQGVWRVGATVQHLELDRFDGEAVGHDPDRLFFIGTGCCVLNLRLKPIYHLYVLNVTYGLLDDLDVNLAVPLGTVNFDVRSSFSFGVGAVPVAAHVDRARENLGIADTLARAKYRLGEWRGWTGAAGFVARLPTGDPGSALGTGDAELGPYLAASSRWWGRVEPDLNLGFDFNVNDLDLSSAHYAAGTTVRATDWLGLVVSFLGRSEVGRRVALADTAGPHVEARHITLRPFGGLDFTRKDFLDLSFGVRLRLYETLVFSLSGLYALNDDGLRSSQVSPVAALEATF